MHLPPSLRLRQRRRPLRLRPGLSTRLGRPRRPRRRRGAPAVPAGPASTNSCARFESGAIAGRGLRRAACATVRRRRSLRRLRRRLGRHLPAEPDRSPRWSAGLDEPPATTRPRLEHQRPARDAFPPRSSPRLLGRFDRLVFSFEVGHLKPRPRLLPRLRRGRRGRPRRLPLHRRPPRERRRRRRRRPPRPPVSPPSGPSSRSRSLTSSAPSGVAALATPADRSRAATPLNRPIHQACRPPACDRKNPPRRDLTRRLKPE